MSKERLCFWGFVKDGWAVALIVITVGTLFLWATWLVVRKNRIHQEPVSIAQEQPKEPVERRLESQGRISSIEEMTETFDAQGNVIERTTRVVVYADKVEAEG